MNNVKLENKIKKSTRNKNYEEAKFTLMKYYIKLFRKMLKYKKVKVEKPCYLHDYIVKVKENYELFYAKDLDEMLDALYSNNYSLKQQISWLLDNYCIFSDYKLY